MTVKSGQTWSGLVVCKDATGALATPSVGPAGALYVDGVANGASVTVTGANPYKWTVTLPTLTAGQTVSMYITATIATIATASVVAEDVADTVRLSDTPAVNVTMSAGIALGGRLAEYADLPSEPLDATATQAAAAAALAAYDPPTKAELDAGLLALVGGDGDTLESLSDQIDLVAGGAAGSGAIEHTITVDDGVHPLDGAEVWISTDEAGANVVAGTLSTDALGQVTFLLDAGTYWKHVQLAGYNFTATEFTVA